MLDKTQITVFCKYLLLLVQHPLFLLKAITSLLDLSSSSISVSPQILHTAHSSGSLESGVNQAVPSRETWCLRINHFSFLQPEIVLHQHPRMSSDPLIFLLLASIKSVLQEFLELKQEL